MIARRTHGTGHFSREDLRACGEGVVLEPEVLIFHPENVSLGAGVYVGHRSILKAYHKNEMAIGPGTWIGQMCFFHSAGGLRIGANVGIGPAVKILTSSHELEDTARPILHAPVTFQEVIVEDDVDIGCGAILTPGAIVRRGAQIGAGAVVVGEVPAYSIAVGVPAKAVRTRGSR